jgi:lambda repressor-like predicted transcriptional regulator
MAANPVPAVLARRAGRDAGDDRYLSLRDLVDYAGLSVRTLRGHLVNRTHPLPHFRIGGKIVVRQREYDDWASRFRVQQVENEIDALVDEVMRDLG